MIAASGFRDYDARWRYPDEIDLVGMRDVGLGLGTQMCRHGLSPAIVLGHDFRSYSEAVAGALTLGLIEAGIIVHDIGLAVSPMAYFAQFHLDVAAVAMVTASHNPNGWTGVKMGFARPLTHGPEAMGELRDIVLGGLGAARSGGAHVATPGIRAAYLDDLCGGYRLSRPLRVVCATGNGTAGAFAPEMLTRIGAEVIGLHTDLDATFPHYNPNPEALEMLADMARAQQDAGADLVVGFDGDGDRLGVVDDCGDEIFADKLGLILARDLIAAHPGARFLVDIKSTGLFATDARLRAGGATVEYGRTGHSHMKRRMQEIEALAGFEKSGHFFFGPPLGRGYDCGLRAALEICKMLDRNPGRRLSDLSAELPACYTSPTMSPACPETEKRGVADRIRAVFEAMALRGESLAGHQIVAIHTADGARVALDHGGWVLVRASSNTPNLVVVCESPDSQADLKAIFGATDAIIRDEPSVGDYDQRL